MIGWIIAAIVAAAAFNYANQGDADPTANLPPAAVEPARHSNPGYEPCSKSDDGVKGRLRAVEVYPQAPCK